MAAQPGGTPPRAPEFVGGADAWINSSPLRMVGLRGKVVLVDIWEYTCVNCIRTLPYLKEWHWRYNKLGLVIVGIHTPEFAFAKSKANVSVAVKRFGLPYPILLDPDYANWNAYNNSYWPRKYLIDQNGLVVYDHIGEGGYGNTEWRIQELLRERDPNVKLPKLMEPVRATDRPGAVCYPTTPEVYAGFLRGRVGNANARTDGKAADYRYADTSLRDGALYLDGRFAVTQESIRQARTTEQPTDRIILRYHAKEVFAVMRPEDGKALRVFLTQDGQPLNRADCGADVKYDEAKRSYVLVDKSRMYSLVNNRRYGDYTLSLSSTSIGFGLYSFTFGSCERTD